MQIKRHPPAWLLGWLPVRLARRCASKSASVTVKTKSATSPEPLQQLLVDVSVIYQSDARTGIQRVVRSLLLQLLKAPPAGYKICPVFATRQYGYRHVSDGFVDLTERAQRISRAPLHVEVQVRSGDFFLGLDLATHLLPRHKAQVLCWKRSGVEIHLLVYDLLPLQHPEWFNPKTTRNFKRWIKWVAVYADNVICISETVKVELRAWLNARFDLPLSALPASTITLGADIDASAPSSGLPANAEFLLAHLRKTPSVLMVGTLEPRKGYDQALAAFEQLWQQPDPTPLLVLVGRPGWKTEALQLKLRSHTQLGKHLFWLEDVSDEYLANLYATCGGVLVASRAEGFGLPLIEAALHGKSVLARDLPVFRETALLGVTFFSGESADSLAAVIPDWLKKTVGKIAVGHDQSIPTWQNAAEQLLISLRLSNHPYRGVDAIRTDQATTREAAV